jgi:hypothetical protein
VVSYPGTSTPKTSLARMPRTVFSRSVKARSRHGAREVKAACVKIECCTLKQGKPEGASKAERQRARVSQAGQHSVPSQPHQANPA